MKKFFSLKRVVNVDADGNEIKSSPNKPKPEVVVAEKPKKVFDTGNVSPLNNKRYPKEITQIHASFAAALEKMKQDKLNAQKKLSPKPTNNESIEALKDLGFAKNKKLVTYEKEKENHLASQEIIDKFENKLTWAEYYMGKYPNYKFITHDLVLDICEKYGLVMCTADKFKDDIPESNLHAMIKFRKEFDTHDVCLKTKKRDYSARSGLERYLPENNVNEEQRKFIWECNKQYGNKKTSEFKFEDNSAYVDSDKAYTHFRCFANNGNDFAYQKGGIRMVAPKKMFDVADWSKLKDHQLIEVKDAQWRQPIDPIMLMPVHTTLENEDDGYLIITAWGDEASDPDVINEKMN